ncbi:hypothetical protein BGZ70_008323 [Mortierella alpina]|uniref:Transmembrane protein n=1 Tax=Mortierella alpina TaxID=64518 RepID=A0A9P6M1Q0_MORAP|nr:hypothetical protein BGZ70_008323 [Mortierella alpina]
MYSRFGGRYANSIRWTRQGGYPEMLTSLCNSWKNLPMPTKVAMTLTIFASLAASVADKGAVYFITPAVRMGAAEPFVVKSPQFVQSGVQRTFSGWSSSYPYGADIVDAMKTMISVTADVPEAISGRVYTPRTSDYVITCDHFDLQFEMREVLASNLLLPNNGCTVVNYVSYGGFQAEFDRAKVVNVAKGRWSIRVPATSNATVASVGTSWSIFVDRRICALGEPLTSVSEHVKSGLTALPSTMVTKCVYPTGEISVLSASVVTFFVPTSTSFRRVAATVFDGHDDLLQAMEVSINNTPATSNATQFTELTSHDSFIEALFCLAYGRPAVSLRCRYHNINMLIIKQQGLDGPITKARGGKPFPYPPSTSIAMTIEHVPILHSGVPQPISMSTLKNATFEAAHYMASLGHNFYADYDEEQLYVLFDTMDPHQGFTVPDWLLISIATIMAVCLCLWGAIKVLLEARYTSSLYKVVATQLSLQTGMAAPMLMRSRLEPFEFERIPVAAAAGSHEVDTSTTKSPLGRTSC